MARPDARLASSPRARWSVALALLGLHGVLPLLPVAWWLAHRELSDIGAQRAPPAGRPLAQGARAVAVIGLLVWAVLLGWWLNASTSE